MNLNILVSMILHIQQKIAELLYSWLLNSPRTAGHDEAYLNNLATAASWSFFGSAFEWTRTGHKLPLDQFVGQWLSAHTASGQPFMVESLPSAASNRT